MGRACRRHRLLDRGHSGRHRQRARRRRGSRGRQNPAVIEPGKLDSRLICGAPALVHHWLPDRRPEQVRHLPRTSLTGSLPWPDGMPDCQEEEDPCRISARWRMMRRSSPANIAASRTRVSSRPGSWPTRRPAGGSAARSNKPSRRPRDSWAPTARAARTCGRKPVARRTTSGDGGVVKVPLFGSALQTNRPFPARPPRARSTPYF